MTDDPTIAALSRADSLRQIQRLPADVACEVEVIPADQKVCIWSPYDSFEGAAKLIQVLGESP